IVANYDAQVTVLDEKNPNNFTNKKFLEEIGLFFADPNFFSVFQYEWLAGDAKVLIAPNTAVIEKKWAEKYFGNWQSAMGRLIMFDNTATMKIGGVLEVPSNTDFPIGIVGSYETMKKFRNAYGYNEHWGSVTSNFQAFMLLPTNVSAESVNKRLTAFSNEHFNTNKKDIYKTYHFLQPLGDIHFNTNFGNFGDHISSRTTLWTLSLIGIFIIIMACINFINLATAQAVG